MRTTWRVIPEENPYEHMPIVRNPDGCVHAIGVTLLTHDIMYTDDDLRRSARQVELPQALSVNKPLPRTWDTSWTLIARWPWLK